MANLKRTQYTMILIILVLFIASIIITIIAGVSPSVSVVDAALDALEVNYNLIQLSIASNPLILAAKILDAMVFPVLTVLLAAWFFDFINHVNIKEKIEISRIQKLEGHVILVPYNNFCKAILKELKNSGIKTVTIVENKKELMQLYRNGELAIHGDVRSIETFEIARISKARAIIACSKDDVQNALIAITAKTANPHIKIISRANEEENVKGLMSAGAYKTFIPEDSAGEEIGKEISRRVLTKRTMKT
ncbi:MAG: NAD(P)-binding protein [Candidatus Micrarchaeaceae archaeon]|jgi:outer membrane lipopolysaccharide assembly protein LptE/RlpB